MDRFTELLQKQYGAVLVENLERRASYYEKMDFLEYVSSDSTIVADRVDDFLTVLMDSKQENLVGFRFKGFKCVFTEVIKPAMKLDDEDFNPIVFALETIFTKVGNELFPNHDPDDDRRRRAYRKALELAKRDKVSLPPELEAA